MKNIVIIVLFAFDIAYGQINPNDLSLPQQHLSLPEPANPLFSLPDYTSGLFFNKKDTTFNFLPDELSTELARNQPASNSSKFLHATSLGSVFILSLDNMPYLVPDPARTEKMPVRKLKNESPVDRMPNMIPRRNIIPPTQYR
jgi:hypothetical protein